MQRFWVNHFLFPWCSVSEHVPRPATSVLPGWVTRRVQCLKASRLKCTLCIPLAALRKAWKRGDASPCTAGHPGIYVYGRFYGGGLIFGVLTQSGRFFGRFRNFGPRSVWTLPKSWPPPYFRHGEFRNEGFLAQQNGGGAIRGPKHGQFLGNLLLLV